MLGKAVTLFEERYGLPGTRAREEDLATLASRFAELPYENLTKIIALAEGGTASPRLRRPEQVMEDHLALGTGGTCFSLVELLRGLATAAGFTCRPAMAHMRHGTNIHCVLLCEAGGQSFVVDPGYLLPRPLPLEPGRAALDGARLGAARVVRAGSLGPVPDRIPAGELDLYTIELEGPLWRYRLDPHPPTPEEFETHWRASFAMPAMRSLLCTRRDSDEILYLHNHKLRRRSETGKQTENVRADLCERVEALFGISPEVTRRAAELVRIARESARMGTPGR